MMQNNNNRRQSPALLSRRGFCLAAAVLFCTVATGAGPLRAEETALSFIRALGDTAVSELAPAGIPPEQREEKFRVLFHESFDVPRITRFALGRYARRVSDAEMQAFTALYEDLAVLTYAHMFATYAGKGFEVKKQLGGAGDKYVMVVSEISKATGAPATRLDWQVLVGKSGFAVVDIRIEGVSMAIAQRDEFTAYLDNNGGDMAAFLVELAGKIERRRADRATQ